MPTFFKPVMATANRKQHIVAPDGSLIEVAYIPVSTVGQNLLKTDDLGLVVMAEDMVSSSENNLLSVGLDGKLVVTAPEYPDVLSVQEGNYLRYGNDKRLYLDGNDVLSNEAVNLIGISAVDGKVLLTRDMLGLMISADEGNIIHPGSDGGAYLTIKDLISGDADNSIRVGEDGKLHVKVEAYTAGEGIRIVDHVVSVRVLSKSGLAFNEDGYLYGVAADYVSLQADNRVELGYDNKLFVEKQVVVSADANNIIVAGSDEGAFFPKDLGTMD